MVGHAEFCERRRELEFALGGESRGAGELRELGCDDRVMLRASRTGAYFAHRIFRLSSPLDLLRVSPLPLRDRLRLGWLTLRVRRLADWHALEDRTAADWLRELAGERVYEVVWEPLLRGKFGELADEVSAVWIWNKLKLRGGSRGRRGAETLAYYRGGFAALVDALVDGIRAQGGSVRTATPVDAIAVEGGRAVGVIADGTTIGASAVIATPALPIVADLVAPHAPAYAASLRRIRYLANLCVVLVLDRSLSDTYWLNVNDPGFPFVAVIEHTNFEPASSYAGRHVVYLSTYRPASDPLLRMPQDELVAFALAHLRRMFPALRAEWVVAAHAWQAEHAQPVVVRRYGELVPPARTPIEGLRLATMAQIYPEDRGTNYAIGAGRAAAAELAHDLFARAQPDSGRGGQRDPIAARNSAA
jgi:protoporphyrinogen oxidase